MLLFKFNGLNSNFENPIISTLILTIIVIIIVILSVSNLTFTSIKYIFCGTLICTYFVLWNNYYYLTKKYYDQIVNKNTEDVISKITQ